ncbi:hypothetical protein AB9P05_10515 [Roseivirga sp. BDSF3-8]|uniref:hypothetical protein n=1 Tax=Roseivirga sp. BDSF3-8 TaxID=3241598 RepID=UPI00353214AB
MQLTPTHIRILGQIHTAHNHRLDIAAVESYQSQDPHFRQALEELVIGDLVEYEAKEHAWYLSHEGFQVVQRLSELDEEEEPAAYEAADEHEVAPLQKMADAMGGTKKFTRLVLGIIFLVGLAATAQVLLKEEQTERPDDSFPDSTQIEVLKEKADSVISEREVH